MHQRRIEIGSQLFINKNDKPDKVEYWVRQMKENNMDVIRLFMIWDQLEPRKDQWDFTNYDACFKEAEKLGMGVIPTLMPISPPGWMQLTNGMSDIANIDNEEFWEVAMAYVKKVVDRYFKSPSLHSWILWNEPSRVITLNEHNKIKYQNFLREKYVRIKCC